MEKVKESVLIYTTKPLSGFYSSEYFTLLPSKIKYQRYFTARLQFELSVGDPYFRFSSNNRDILAKKVIEFNMLFSLISQFYFFGFRKRKTPIKQFSSTKNYSKMEFGNIQWYQDKSLDDHNIDAVIFPKEAEILFEKYFSLTGTQLKYFQQALLLFYNGIELKLNYQSHSFLSFVSAIETLTQAEFEKENELINIHKCCNTIISSPWKCEKCESDLWGISQKYRKFVIKYAFNGSTTAAEKALVYKIYSIRSKIVHNGQLLVANDFWNDDDHPNWEESFIHKDLLHLTRVSVLNWLLNTG